jgi:hypothetical protein
VSWDYLPSSDPVHTSVRIHVARVRLHVWGGARYDDSCHVYIILPRTPFCNCSVTELAIPDGVQVSIDNLLRLTHSLSIDVSLRGGAAATLLVPRREPTYALVSDWERWREVTIACCCEKVLCAS